MSYKQRILTIAGVLLVGVFVLLALAYYTFQRPTVKWVQWGPRGSGMVQLYNSRVINSPQVKALNAVPEPVDVVEPAGTKASEVYQNVQVLKDIDSNELLRQMTAIASWVAPDVGCSYCHADGHNFAEDVLYTKIVPPDDSDGSPSQLRLETTRGYKGRWRHLLYLPQGQSGSEECLVHPGSASVVRCPPRQQGRSERSVGNRRLDGASERSLHAVPAWRSEHPCVQSKRASDNEPYLVEAG